MDGALNYNYKYKMYWSVVSIRNKDASIRKIF